MRLLVAFFCFAVMLALAPAASADDERFGHLVAEATAAFGQGEFERAIDLAEQAYAIRKDPRLLYNVARAHEALGNLEPSIDHYRRYLEADPESKNREVVNGRILALETTLAERVRLEGERLEAKGQRQAAIAAYRRYLARARRARDRSEIERRIADLRRPIPREKSAKSAPAPAGFHLWPWVTIGAGAAILGAGGAFAVLSRKKYDDAESATDGESAIHLQDDGDRYTDFANVGFVAGGVVLAGGVTWLLFSPSVAKGSRQLSLGVGRSQLRIEGSF